MAELSVNARIDRIATKLQTVARGRFQPFGFEGHRFHLRPPLAEQQVADFENHFAITLPTEYRTFIIRVADGGVGPAYGMFSLREALTKERCGPIPDDLLRTPFPHRAAYNPIDDPEVEAFCESVRDDKISEADAERRELYQSAGTLDLCHEGCGYLHFLVVSGPARGQMWMDARCSDGGFVPLRVGFLDWYEQWLDSILAGGDGVWWMS